MRAKEFDETILDQIIYRGEGNSSLVVALKSRTKVIRLLKKDGKIMKSSQDHHVSQHPMRSLQFIHLIMKPLTEPFLSGPMELVHLKSDFINSLSTIVENHRPSHRLDKTLLLDDQYALVMDDLCALPSKLVDGIGSNCLCGPTISIEIKPKQGFLPIRRLLMKPSLNDQSANKIRNCCIYGSVQYLKLARGRIREASDYCPINLFSGCPKRMKSALASLLKNPQNNLRIFKDLILAYGENHQSKVSQILGDLFEDGGNPLAIDPEERLLDILVQSLLNLNVAYRETEMRDLENSFGSACDICLQHQTKEGKCNCCDISPSKRRFKSELNHRLPKSCVLSSVLRAQKLDTIGAHEASHMLEWLLEDSKQNGGDILEELSKPQMPKGFGSPHHMPDETKQEFYFRKVWEFLVSLTAKDCSIIVTLRRVGEGYYESIVASNPVLEKHILREEKSGNYYMFNVGIADLDQKMPLKIPRICDNLNSIQL